MQALTWHGKRDVRVESVPDPQIEEPTDAIIEVTSTAICGSDLHLYELLGMWLEEGDILGHEAMGVVQEVGTEVTNLQPGDRVVVPFNISCGHCYMCDQDLFAQCETTQVREYDKGAALLGYTKLYGQVPGGQAEYLRVPQAQFGPVKVPHDHPDQRFLYLSDVLPTAWQAVAFADVPQGGSLTVFGLGPIGQFCARIARYHGIETVIGVDRVPERLEMARRHGVDVIDLREQRDVGTAIRQRTQGRGTDGVIDAVGMEAHGWPAASAALKAASYLPDRISTTISERMGVDPMDALLASFDAVRRGGTVSIVGVYAGQTDPFPMLDLFDKGVQLRMGQAHVKRWTGDILNVLLEDDDILGTGDMCTHSLPLEQAPQGYALFQKKLDNAIKVVLEPGRSNGRTDDRTTGSADEPAERRAVVDPGIGTDINAGLDPDIDIARQADTRVQD